MRTSTQPFDLRGWRQRLGITQARAADVLGLSASAYRKAEYRATDRAGHPVNKTLARLAMMVEAHGVLDKWRS